MARLRGPRSGGRGEGVFYGWYVVGALFFMSFIVIGARQGFGVFVEAWETDFKVSVATVSIAASVGWLMNGVSQPLFGWLTDRIGGRRVLIYSLLVMGLSSAAVALSNNVYVLIGVYGFVLSFVSGGLSFTPTGAVIARWFRRKRGTAMSVLTVGGSVSGLIMIPFAAYLLELTDWRTTWLVLGGLMLVIGLPTVIVIVRSDPSDVGERPDGDPEYVPGDGATQPAVQHRPGPLLTDQWQPAFKSAPIWQLSVAYWVCGVTTAMIAVHFVRWASTEGISASTAALAFGLLSAINGMGVLGAGWLSDRFQRKHLLAAVYLVRAFAFVALFALPGSAALWTFAVLGGASWLATVPLTTSLAADIYGVRQLGTLAGLINFAHQIGGAGAVFLAGLVFDVWGTYDPAFVAGAALLVGAGIVSLAVRERAYSSRYQPAPTAGPMAVAGAAADGD